MQTIIKERKLSILIFILSIGLLIAIAISNYYTTRRFIEISEHSKIVHTVLNEMDDIFYWVTNVESKQRGFIITDKEFSLKNYYQIRDSIFHTLIFVKNNVQSKEAKNLFPNLEILIDQRLDKLDEAITVHRKRGFKEAAKFIETDTIRVIKDSIQSIIYKIQEIENKQYEIIEAATKKSAEWTVINTMIGYAAAIIFLVSIFMALLREIAARIHSEERTSKYAEEVNDLYNNAPIGYYSLDPEGKIISINNTQLKWLDYDKKELVNTKKFADILDAESAARFIGGFTALKQGEEIADVELNVIKKNGQLLPVLWNSTGVVNAKGEFLMSRSTLFDNTKLSRNKQNLEAVNKELQSFAYSVSHDLRAPLRHINGFIDLLIQKSAEKLDEQGKRYLNIIHEASQKMGVLIDELLSFSRMSRQDFLKTKVDLNAVLEDSIQTLMEYNSKRKIEWLINELPQTECDPAMMRIVFNNILSNAIKFTSKQETAKIEIGCYEKDGKTIIYIKDNGAGFDMAYSSKLFGVFQRLHRQDEFEGNGIGLATVRRIINRHGGTIWAESEIGKGASFYFTLPVV